MLRKILLCVTLGASMFNPWIANADSSIVSSVKAAISDTAITAQVKALYLQSPLINQSNISVTTTDNIVMLSGTVKTDLQYEKAIALATSVKGVRDVDASKLLVPSSKTPLEDTYTTAKVKGTLIKEKLFGDKDIQYWPIGIETKNSVVYITGTVDTDEQRINIINLVRGIKGVKVVECTINVK